MLVLPGPGAGGILPINVDHPPGTSLATGQGSRRRPVFEPLSVAALAAAAGLSPAHFSRQFRRAFGESPHRYLHTRRLERAAALLRNTDRTVADICIMVGFTSVGSFTSSFGRTFGLNPTAYRSAYPPAAARARIPDCLLRAWGRPHPQTARLEKTGDGNRP